MSQTTHEIAKAVIAQRGPYSPEAQKRILRYAEMLNCEPWQATEALEAIFDEVELK